MLFKGIRQLKPQIALSFVSESCGAVRQREEANAPSEKYSGTVNNPRHLRYIKAQNYFTLIFFTSLTLTIDYNNLLL